MLIVKLGPSCAFWMADDEINHWQLPAIQFNELLNRYNDF